MRQREENLYGNTETVQNPTQSGRENICKIEVEVIEQMIFGVPECL